MTGQSAGPSNGWFRTITHPTSHLLATIAALVVFVGGIWMGYVFDEFRVWFYAVAVIVILGWYLLMMKSYRAARVSSPPRS